MPPSSGSPPASGSDERALDARLSAETRDSIRREQDQGRNPVEFYSRFLTGILRGDAGRSLVFSQPVGRLIRERFPPPFAP